MYPRDNRWEVGVHRHVDTGKDTGGRGKLCGRRPGHHVPQSLPSPSATSRQVPFLPPPTTKTVRGGCCRRQGFQVLGQRPGIHPPLSLCWCGGGEEGPEVTTASEKLLFPCGCNRGPSSTLLSSPHSRGGPPVQVPVSGREKSPRTTP